MGLGLFEDGFFEEIVPCHYCGAEGAWRSVYHDCKAIELLFMWPLPKPGEVFFHDRSPHRGHYRATSVRRHSAEGFWMYCVPVKLPDEPAHWDANGSPVEL